MTRLKSHVDAIQAEVDALTTERDELTEPLARELRCNAIADDLFEAYVERLEADLQREVARLRTLVEEACNAAECRPLSHDGENIKRVWAARIGAIREAASGVPRPKELLHDRVHQDLGLSRPARSVRGVKSDR